MSEFKWPPSSGSGLIAGPGASTDNAVVRWDGANGDTAQNSVVLISDTGAVTGVTTLAASGAITGSNLSGTNTGDQTISLTGDVTGSGTGSFAATIGAGKVTNTMLATASSAANNSYVVLRNVAGNSNFNNVGINTTTVVSAAQTVTMTYASTGNQRITGTSTVRYNLPDATYMTNGDTFQFNNNSTGIVSVYKADNATLVATIPGGGLAQVLCTDNGTTNGTWDYHNLLANGSISGTTGTTLLGTLTTDQIIDSGLTANTVPYANASKQLTSSAVTPTELGYVSGVTSAIQTQMNLKAPLASPTFTGPVTLADGSVSAPSLAFGGTSSNTGWYLIGADNIGLASNGVKTIDVSSAGAVTLGSGTSSVVDHLFYGKSQLLSSTSSFGVRQIFTSGATNGRTWHIGHNFVSGNGEFSIYDHTAASERASCSTAGAWANIAGGSWGTISDERLKTNIQDLAGGLSTILQLRPVTYVWKDDNASPLRPTTHFIAQEVEQVNPNWVVNSGGQTITVAGVEETLQDVKQVQLDASFNAYIVKAIQEQQALIVALEARLAALES